MGEDKQWFLVSSTSLGETSAWRGVVSCPVVSCGVVWCADRLLPLLLLLLLSDEPQTPARTCNGQVKDCSLPILGDFFFIVLVLWGAFFTVNLLLAVLETNFSQGSQPEVMHPDSRLLMLSLSLRVVVLERE